VLNALIQSLRSKASQNSLLNRTEFRRELARERIRATRRAFPFCVLEISLKPNVQGADARSCRKQISQVLHRNVRLTDHKAQLSASEFAVLFTDTPEMGGRSAMSRLEALFVLKKVPVEMRLEVFDRESFASDDESDSNGSSSSDSENRRRSDGRHDRQWRDVSGGVDLGDEVTTTRVSAIGRMAKRGVDIVGATCGLIMTGPVILAAIASIRWTDGQSAIFKQTREGYRGRPFTIYKLRTMIVDAEAQQDALRDQSHRDGPAFKITNDPRVTRVGNFLRKTCLDELPQLWNVLKGDMSLVGPRPLPWHESRACQHWHRRRLDVRPGMTCYWQVQKDSIESFDDWMRLDLRYVEQLGLVEDIRLIVKTIAVPVLGRGGH
jgi:lipopolysaccharide/colanic/teichoic acid biosynthesis glycosyltransferase/GGDEF domain-containing protein